jgi:hypothetical protein
MIQFFIIYVLTTANSQQPTAKRPITQQTQEHKKIKNTNNKENVNESNQNHTKGKAA